MFDCLYVTRGWGIHDERWLNALRQQGFDPKALSLTDDLGNLPDICAEVDRHDGMPILAGPLNPTTHALVDLSAHIVGLSWGFDLHRAAPIGLDWLTQLAGLIVDSSATREIALQAGVAPEKITLLPWGVDLAQFSPIGPHRDLQDLDLPDEPQIVLSLRAHEDLYRISDIVEGFARVSERHPSAVLVIGNEGSLTPTLEQQAADLGISGNVRFIGRIPEDALAPLLRSASVYVTASEVDGTSVTLLQAMACATPVLASKNPGNLDWVSAHTGSVFETGNTAQIAEQLDALLTDPEHARERGRSAHALVSQRADWHRNITRLGKAMRQAAA